MSTSKSRLKAAKEEAQVAIDKANNAIQVLGSNTKSLYDILGDIQHLFNKIKNVPDETMMTYQNITKVRLTWKQQVDNIEDNWKKATQGKVAGGAAGVGFGVGVAALGPTAAMGIATTFGVASTGTAISALSGAAATNAALAWLGGGALAAGGGGMAAGEALLAMAGPVGWAIAGVAFLTSGLLLWKSRSEKKKLEEIFTVISKRDVKSYNLATVELNERIKRIISESELLNEACVQIATFGTDYKKMTEKQQYTLGSYVNLMYSSTQLLVNPILGLQPKYTEDDFNGFVVDHFDEFEQRMVPFFTNYLATATIIGKTDSFGIVRKTISDLLPGKDTHRFIKVYSSKTKSALISLCNLLYRIELNPDEKDILAKSLRKNKDFMESTKIEKDVVNRFLFDTVDVLLNHKYENSKS